MVLNILIIFFLLFIPNLNAAVTSLDFNRGFLKEGVLQWDEFSLSANAAPSVYTSNITNTLGIGFGVEVRYKPLLAWYSFLGSYRRLDIQREQVRAGIRLFPFTYFRDNITDLQELAFDFGFQSRTRGTGFFSRPNYRYEISESFDLEGSLEFFLPYNRSAWAYEAQLGFQSRIFPFVGVGLKGVYGTEMASNESEKKSYFSCPIELTFYL